MAPIETPTDAAVSAEFQTAQRLRTMFGRMSRLLRPTDTGSASDLTPTRVSVLLAADHLGPVRLSEIAQREGLNPTLLSRTVANLVEAGLIERTADPSDRRSAWIAATTAGHEAAEGIRRERTVHLQQALVTLSADDLRVIGAALPAFERLIESVRAGNGEGTGSGERS